MCFTHFTLLQDGKPAGSSTDLEQAVSATVRLAMDTGTPVTVVAHVAGGGFREAVINPDGTNEGIWNIDKGLPFSPAVGQVYVNRGGGRYRGLSVGTGYGPVYFNAAGGSSSISAVVNALRDYANMLESVIPEWGLTGYHAAVYELHAARCREIAGKYAAALDRWSRPVYEGSDGSLYVDADPRADCQPKICTKCGGAFDGEPDCPVHADFTFVPRRDTW